MKDTLLCDNESSCDAFCNPKCVKNIRKAKGTLTITSNGGSLAVETTADLTGYPKPVWFDERAITGVISFANFADHFFVECDNRKEDAFFVHKHNGEILIFARSKCGLHFHNLNNK